MVGRINGPRFTAEESLRLRKGETVRGSKLVDDESFSRADLEDMFGELASAYRCLHCNKVHSVEEWERTNWFCPTDGCDGGGLYVDGWPADEED
jgi:hypothetical protein